MASGFDLNVTVENDESNFLFDLNKIPSEEESVNNSYEDIPVNQGHGEVQSQPHLRKTRKFLSNEQRYEIFGALLERSIAGKLAKGITREVSQHFSVSIATVQGIWRRAKAISNNGKVNVSHRKTGNCGRKRITIEPSQVTDVPLCKRTTLRSMSMAMNVSLTTLFRRKKEGLIRRHTNSIKPYLKEANIRGRLQFCISMLDKNSLPHEPMFVDMYNIVHIDEKWFYLTKRSEKYYLLSNEEEPQRTCQSKNYITKVMFLAAMARPRFDEEGNEVFDGKIGIFPFVTLEPAKRKSKNRDAGTLELKALTSVKRENIKAFLIEKVLLNIQEKWPKEDKGKSIFIQQDNARTHVECGDEDFQEAASKTGFDIRLMNQPPNSPDLNILDLGFFAAIQSLQYKECPKNIEDLVHAVEESFKKYSTERINHIFLTLQSCMYEVMKIGGENKYKIPHMNIYALDKNGLLPTSISCDALLVQNVMNTLGLLE